MKITIISLDNWGFNKYIVKALEEDGHQVHHINFNKYKYRYPSILHKAYNFFLKTFFKQNLKTRFYGRRIIRKLKEIKARQDLIITIKADHIDIKSLRELKKYARKSIAFFNDNTQRCPKIIPAIPLFDKVYSFEKDDCERFGMEFTTNWIYNYDPSLNETGFLYQVFHISSRDRRLPIISKIAAELRKKGIVYKIIMFARKEHSNPDLDYISEHMPLQEMNEYIKRSQSLLDIHRSGQKGLTFRVFESLGLQKKLITTNPDIVNYDFYNPQNILVIDPDNLDIPVEFFKTAYEPVPPAILDKYLVDKWAENLIKNL
ncbi:MAG TPA: hypothetical protein VGB43_00340 [Flavobacterium sp.]